MGLVIAFYGIPNGDAHVFSSYHEHGYGSPFSFVYTAAIVFDVSVVVFWSAATGGTDDAALGYFIRGGGDGPHSGQVQ